MGRRLTPSERAQREREKKARQAKSREATKRRRAAEKSAREAAAQKDQELGEKIALANDEAMFALKNLHKPAPINNFLYVDGHSLDEMVHINLNKPEPQLPFVPQVMPAFQELQDELLAVSIQMKETERKSNFDVKDYIKFFRKIIFFIIYKMNNEQKKYEKFIDQMRKEFDLMSKDFIKIEAKIEESKKDWKKKEDMRKKEFFENAETQKERLIKQLEKKNSTRIKWFKDLKLNKSKNINQALEIFFPLNFIKNEQRELLENSDEMEWEVGFNFSRNKLDLAISLPDTMKFFPKKWSKISRGGKNISEYVISDTEANSILRSVIASSALAYIKSGFLISNANKLNIEIFTRTTNPATGKDSDLIFCQIKANKKDFLNVNIDMVEPVAALNNFSSVFNPPKYENSYLQYSPSIKSLFDYSKLIWTDSNDIDIDGLSKDLSLELRHCYNKFFDTTT